MSPTQLSRRLRRGLVGVLAIGLGAAGCGTSTHHSSSRSAVLPSKAGGSRSVAGSARPAWPAPTLTHAQTITLTSRTPTKLVLDPRRDYVLRLPRRRVLDVPNGFQIIGGHNVVMIGGTLNITRPSGVMILQDQTGTVHIEGVRFTGPHLLEGFDLSEAKGATVELEHIYVATVHGSQETNHADLIQTWAGPKRLLIDGFVGSSDYQGFFLLPNQHDSGPPPQAFDLRNVYINDHGGYALWLQSSPRVPVNVANVYVTPNPEKPQRASWLWPSPDTAATWGDVGATSTAPGPVVKLARPSGIDYPRAGTA